MTRELSLQLCRLGGRFGLLAFHLSTMRSARVGARRSCSGSRRAQILVQKSAASLLRGRCDLSLSLFRVRTPRREQGRVARLHVAPTLLRLRFRFESFVAAHRGSRDGEICECHSHSHEVVSQHHGATAHGGGLVHASLSRGAQDPRDSSSTLRTSQC